MRTILLLSGGLLSLLLACQTASSPPHQGENAATQASTEDLRLENLPEQGPQANTVTLSGQYFLPQQDGLVFEVELVQNGDSITGSYCGHTETRSDCGMPSQGAPDCGIRGLIRNNVAYLIFHSCYMDQSGLAQLVRQGQDLIWQTTRFPDRGEGIYFCAAPDSALLRNKAMKFAQPVQLPKVETAVSGLLVPHAVGKTKYIFGTTKVLHTLHGTDFQTHLQAGTPVQILAREGEYVYSQMGDETFEVPAYRIRYEEYGQSWEGFVHHDAIALQHFQDDRGNLFLLGLEEEEDLQWRVRDHTESWQSVSTGLKNIKERERNSFPLFDYRIVSYPDLRLGDHSFLACELHYRERGESYTQANLFRWDGQTLAPVLPEVPRVFRRHLQLSVVNDLLLVDFQTPKTGYADDFYQNASQRLVFELQDQILHPLEDDGTPGVALAYPGDNNQHTFPDAFESLAWFGVRVADSSVQLEPVELHLEKNTTEEEMRGTIVNKSIAPGNGQGYDFLISNLDEVKQNGRAGGFSAGELQPGKEIRLQMPGTDWRFSALGYMDQYGPVEFSLLLTGTREGRKLEQSLHYSPFREMPVEFLWAGDLDGDQLPDFIVEVSDKGIISDRRLYLSSLAQPGKLVGLAGRFSPDEPGS